MPTRISANGAEAMAFLGVSSSALGRRWFDRLDATRQREALTIAQAHGVSDTLSRIMAGRGIVVGDVEDFLEPTLRRLMPDPSTLRDMDVAAERLLTAILRREKTAIFGDYDVDGATSAALLASYLRAFGVPTEIHIPDRITEGYGPNVTAIKRLRTEGATLLVTVDCGVSSHGPLAEAKAIGLDVVVLDHHLAPADLPRAAAVVNPNRQDDVSGLGSLAACGVVFLTLVKLQARVRNEPSLRDRCALPDLLDMLDLVALGTVADVVPLLGLNRAFVRQGLKVMRQRRRLGLSALMDAAGLNEPPAAYHLGFLLGPRINAGGRIGDAALGARLLLTDDPVQAARLAGELDQLNRERQTLEQAMVADAIAMVEEDATQAEASIVVVGSAAWHPGVVGLVASRLKERFRKPSLAIAWAEPGSEGEGTGVGSARSIPGVDLGRAVRAAVEAGHAIKGGGHAMAAGLTVQAAAIADLRAFLAERLTEAVTSATEADALLVDAALTAGSLTPELMAEIERAGPFGQGNPEPLIALPAHRLEALMPVGTAHLKLKLRAGDGSIAEAMAFRAQGQPLGEALQAARDQPIHALGALQLDRWGGRERVTLRLVDFARASAARA